MFSMTSMATAAALALSLAGSAVAANAHDGVLIRDAMIRISTPNAKTAAGFFTIDNHSDQEDRLLSAHTALAERSELHTNKVDANGMMRMLPVPEGIAVAPLGTHALESGGDHVMFLGLTQPLRAGDQVEVTLTFARAGEVVVAMPVVLTGSMAKAPKAMGHGSMMEQGAMEHGTMDHGTMNHGAMPGMTGN